MGVSAGTIQGCFSKGRSGLGAGKRYLRAATSIGANVEEAQSAESRPDFAHKYGIAQKEARESLYRLKLLAGSGVIPSQRLRPLTTETEELFAVIAGIILSEDSRRPLSVMSETERRLETPSPVPPRLKNVGGGPPPWGRGQPSPLGRGWTATALSPAVAGRVRGQLHGEDGSDRPGASCSIDTSNASSFWRARRGEV